MKTFHFWIGIALFVLFCWIEIPSQPQANEMAAITILMAYWWFTECIHFTVTSLLPLVLFPILRIESSKNTATEYMDSIIFLFIGGFFFAFALQKWNLHQRLALILLTKIGKSLSSIPNTIVYGTQKIPIKFLLLIGLIMDLIGILFVSLWTYYWILL